MSSPTQPRFVVGIDFSETSYAAMDLALAFAKHYQAELFLIHVIEYPGTFSGAERRDLYEEKKEAEATKTFRDLQKELKAKAVQATTKVVIGEVKQELQRYFQEIDGDLLFVGAHGHRESSVPFAGDVTLGLLRTCAQSIMVVHKHLAMPDRKWRALMPISREYGVSNLAQYLKDCRWNFEVGFELLHVYEPESEAAAKAAEMYMTRKVEELVEMGLPCEAANFVPGTDVSQKITDFVNSSEYPFDMIILENRIHADFGMLSVGGILEKTLHGSSLPVLCVGVSGKAS